MYLRLRSSKYEYNVRQPLWVVDESDHEITITKNLKLTRHCKAGCGKANSMLAL